MIDDWLRRIDQVPEAAGVEEMASTFALKLSALDKDHEATSFVGQSPCMHPVVSKSPFSRRFCDKLNLINNNASKIFIPKFKEGRCGKNLH